MASSSNANANRGNAPVSKDSWLRSFMDKFSLKEDGSNYADWEMNFRLAIQGDGKEQFLTTSVPDAPASNASANVRNSYYEFLRESGSIKNVLIFAMAPALQRRMLHLTAYQIFVKLTEMFSQNPRVLQFEAAVRFFEEKLQGGQPVGPHVSRLLEHMETLERLGHPIPDSIAVDRILHSLHDGFNHFKVNFNLHQMKKTPQELLPILTQVERDLAPSGRKVKDVLSMPMKRTGKEKKNKKKKGKKAAPVTPAAPPPPAPSKGKGKGAASTNAGPSREQAPTSGCFHCGAQGHWRRDCPKYLRENPSTSGIYVIEVNYAYTTSWVLDSGCGSHLCNNLQGLKGVRQLPKGEVDLRMGNGARVAAVSVGTYVLSLISGLELHLKECYYVPTLRKSIISVSVLAREGFLFEINNSGCTFSLNGIVYGVAKSVNGIYIIELSNETYHIESKRLKQGNPDLSFLWHWRLGHVNENRVKRLISTGVLAPFDFKSFGICESCLSGKMARAPFKGKGVRKELLLDLIHSDVCGPMTISARGGYHYFVTLLMILVDMAIST